MNARASAHTYRCSPLTEDGIRRRHPGTGELIYRSALPARLNFTERTQRALTDQAAVRFIDPAWLAERGYSPREIARIYRAAYHPAPLDPSKRYAYLGVRAAGEGVEVDGRPITLKPCEARFVAALARAGRYYTTAEDLGAIGGFSPNSVKVLASRTRQRLRPLGVDVGSFYRRGYRLEKA